jgi:predicted GIY-YIG superfamily endonuclease
MSEHHYYCYILQSCCSRTSREPYVGSTKAYDNRLEQHNGLRQGGARHTQVGRPWEFVAVVHGFSNEEFAQKFESAWQNPGTSTYVRNNIGDMEAH